MSSAHLDTDAARRLVATLETDAPRARNRADASGEAADLARVVELGLLSVPAARVFADSGARRELAAFDAGLARELRRWFTAPFAREAAMRAAMCSAQGALAKQSMGVASLMRGYRAFDESARRAARAELDRVLAQLYQSTAVREISDAFAPVAPASLAAASSPSIAAPQTGGLLVLPSAELIQGLAGGNTLDPAMLAALAASPSPAPTSDVAAPSPPAAEDAPPPEPDFEPALAEILRALAESILGSAPQSLGAWRAACAGFHVADFRAAPLEILGRATFRTLPFEHPAVPLVRRGAIVEQDVDAWSTSTSLFGLGRELVGDPFGGALLATTATRTFVTRALSDRPGDPAKAARTFALAIGFRFAASRFYDRDDADSMRAAYDQIFRASPSMELAEWWSIERRLASAPGEDDAIYAHTPALSSAILRGINLAATLRDNFDEDWFRNPRLNVDRLRDLALLATPATGSSVIAWLREHARL